MKALVLIVLMGLGVPTLADAFLGWENANSRYLTATASSVWSSPTAVTIAAGTTTGTGLGGPYFLRVWAPSTNAATIQVRVSKSTPLSTDVGMEIQPGDYANLGWYKGSGWNIYVKTSNGSALAGWVTVLR